MGAYFTAGIILQLVLTGSLISMIVGDYRVGIGIADTTGPVAEVVFMGYAKSSQVGTGLHLRQFSRAFIIEDDNARILFVSVDAPMIGHGLRKQILDNLKKQYNDTYTEKNFILSATHTHSTPGGAMMDLLFDLTSFGFVRETFQALAAGITRAIMKAHDSMQNAKIFHNSGELLNANINRSPLAYLLNPHEERQRYPHNTDKEMSQLKFVAESNNKLLGSIQWFPVHPTSMNNTNKLVSSDNVGYASILLEEHVNNGTLPGKGSFVGAFASTNLGDVSPNIRGPHCLNSGLPCDDVTSTCDGDAKICVASGPGTNMFGSTKIIGERLFGKALELLEDNNAREVTGKLRIGHQYVHMPSQVIKEKLENGTEVTMRGCTPAMGYSFAAGTTDGPGEFDFKQGTVNDNMLWNILRNVIAIPTVDDIACHHPKPILLLTGKIKYPYEWQPQTIAIQTAIIGNVVLAAVPGEFTTMAGRRLRDSIKNTVKKNGGAENVEVIISGLSNIYSDYIVTPEEYQLQRYEGASTIYGPNTLPIYLHLYNKLIDSLYNEESDDSNSVAEQPTPPDLSKNLISFIPPVIYDWAGFKLDFGDCLQQPQSVAGHGDVVIAKFVAGHPRNNVMQEKTFLTIERHSEDDDWEVVASDANWETKFIWDRTSVLKGSSSATIEWTITKKVKPGVYRIRHLGYYKYILGGIYPYEGLSDNFRVL